MKIDVSKLVKVKINGAYSPPPKEEDVESRENENKNKETDEVKDGVI